MADDKRPGWGALLPRFNIPETFGAALSYEGQLHWFLENWDEVAEYANSLEQPTVTVGKTEFPDTGNDLLPSITNSGTGINAVLDFTYPVIRTRFADPLEWDFDTTYDVLTVVSDGNGNSYTSRQSVPAHTPLTDPDYWVLTGVYDASLQAIREDVAQVKSDYARVYKTAAEMQADTTLVSGMVCRTLGFHTAGDGGAAWYVIGSGEPNGMDVLQLATNDVAVFVPTTPVMRPEFFGAVGDGVTDDTKYLQRAIELSANLSRVTVLSGNYLITDSIVIADGRMSVIGYVPGGGRPGVTLSADGITAFRVTNSGSKFCNLRVSGSFGDSVGIDYDITRYTAPSDNANTDSMVYGCVFADLGTGIVVSGRNVHIYGTEFSQCTYGVRIVSKGAELKECRNTFIDSCQFHTIGYRANYNDNESACVYADNSVLDEYVPYDTVIKDCYAQFSTSLYRGNSYVCVISNQVFAPNSSYALVNISNAVKGNQRNHTTMVCDNTVYKDAYPTGSTLTRFVLLRNVANAVVSRNVCADACSSEACFVTNSEHVVITDNNFSTSSTSLAAQASASGYCSGNCNYADSTYIAGGMTIGTNIVVG